MRGAGGAGDGLERGRRLGHTSEKHAEEGARRKEPENVRWQGQRRRCIIETEARAEGWVRGVQDCGGVQVQNIFSAFFSQELLGSYIGSSFKRMREGRS